jgi:hypothetical protein
MPAAQAPKPDEKKEPAAYQIPETAGATAPAATPKSSLTPSIAAPSTASMPATASNAPESATAEESMKWNHPERLQRARWRDSLGDSATQAADSK